MNRSELFAYIKKTYQAEPEFLWKRYPDFCVFRHQHEGGPKDEKWFAFVGRVRSDKLGTSSGGSGLTDILNVKADPDFINFIVGTLGYFPGYHMNKKGWLTVLLDGTVSDREIENLLSNSYDATAAGYRKKTVRTAVRDWIVPANPKYYDIVGAFEQEEEIVWKQTANMIVGDTCYMYTALPYSAVLYKCQVTETEIPYHDHTGSVKIDRLMKIKKLAEFNPSAFPLAKLKTYGVSYIRGPRSIPDRLRRDLETYLKKHPEARVKG
jgi:predicted DNA-binding protein (MmcQ/YjbR family)